MEYVKILTSNKHFIIRPHLLLSREESASFDSSGVNIIVALYVKMQLYGQSYSRIRK